MQLSVMNSPFTEEQTKELNRLLPTLTEQQKIWLCGYLSFSSTTNTELKIDNVENKPNPLHLPYKRFLR